MNYSMREYANDVIYTIGSVCRTEGIPMPHVISESGRAITAHHALLLINVIDVESQVEPVAPPLRDEPHPLLVEMTENLEGITADRIEDAATALADLPNYATGGSVPLMYPVTQPD